MFRSCSERMPRLWLMLALGAMPVATAPALVSAQEARAAARTLEGAAAVSVAAQEAAEPQEAQEGRRIVSSEISTSHTDSRLTLEFGNGRRLTLEVRNGHAFEDNRDLGPVSRDLDRSWRELLSRAMNAPAEELGSVLAAWEPPAESPLHERLTAALGDSYEPALAPAAPAATAQTELSDSLERLVERIAELQAEVGDADEDLATRMPIAVRLRTHDGSFWSRGPLRHVFAGIGGLLKSAIIYGILFAISFATIFFGGRRFIEGVGDTVRAAAGRSLLVGLAASFLIIPVFILGILALAISIIGIPALLAWIPLFPIAVGLSLLLGYIGVAHAAGEALAERRFYASDWFQRGNSYYFLMTGLGLLLAPFIVTSIVRMAGPWLGFLHGICVAVGVLGTWAALSIGLGAVLISRAGTRPLRPRPSSEPEIYAEPTSA